MAYCMNCGTEEREDQRFCTVCGAPRAGTSYASPMPPLSREGWSGEAQVRLGMSLNPPRQSRWTVLFRFLMAIPLFVFALIIGIAAFFATVAAWFCALFTGRVPDGLQQFLTGALRLYANVGAYFWLLTARWPGFGLDARASDQVTIDVDHVELRRSAVFFRIVLAYPASIVCSVLMLGTYPVLVIVWVAALVSGRAPRTLHQALALVWRFQIRLQAFASLLTPTQPFRGLFGDQDDQNLPGSSATVAGAPTITSQLGTQPIDPVMFPEAATMSTPTTLSPPPIRWIVTKAAKSAVIIIVIIGVLSYFFSNVIAKPLITRIETSITRSIVTSSHADVARAMHQFAVDRQSCRASDSVTCLSHVAAVAHDQIARQFSTSMIASFAPAQYRSLALSYQSAINVVETEMAEIRDSVSMTIDSNIINGELPNSIAQVNASYHTILLKLGQ